MIPVNLYVDRMSPVQPVRVADVYSITQNRAAIYHEAAAEMGMTGKEYAEFREALTGGNVDYVTLPRHIDAMAGVHRSGRVYVLKNVEVPAGEMGWRIALADGTVVYIPRACGNLSMNRAPAVAARPKPVVHRHLAAIAPFPIRVSAKADPPIVPVSFSSAPVQVAPAAPLSIPAAAPIEVPVAAAENSVKAAYFVPLIPFLYGLASRNAPATVAVPPCSEGSNTLGVCR